VPNNVNLQSELLWSRRSLVVMTNDDNTLLVIAVLLNNANTLTFPSLQSCYLMNVKFVCGDRLREKVLLEQAAVKHVR
jgi:hypothetical protein